MKWLRCLHEGLPTWGTLEGDRVRMHRGTPLESAQPLDEWLPAESLQWLPPCVPGKIIALWNNFRAAAQKNGWAAPADPLYFLKSPNSAAGHRQTIAMPAGYDGRVAYEGELAVVLGRRARAVSIDDAPGCILGYTCANDLTALEIINRDPAFQQWTRAKSFDGFAAFGPVIETDFEPATASLRTLVGGRERQNYALSDMFFSPAELVWRVSHDMTLEPGDVIFCGTSLGVLPMKPGSTVEIVIDGIGTLSNTYG
jgi:2-keto-4-pentenoate hydratase/2-oxohepta-3-ene-1,7-dioic acid hydratase in catechol pathway